MTGTHRDKVHPRPQLTRAEWYDLSGPWRFAFDDADDGRARGWAGDPSALDRTIVVPFPPESPASGIGDHSPHAALWYGRIFHVPGAPPGHRWHLHFGAVDYRAEVWVNGRFVVRHEGGHTPFSADISDALDLAVADQLVVLRVEDPMTDLTQPRGKQYWELDPFETWFHRTSGIWQTVWLEPVPPTHIAAVRWTPDLGRSTLGIHVRLNRPPDCPLALRVSLSVGGEPLLEDRYRLDGPEVGRDLALDVASHSTTRRRLVWAPEHPNLIEARLSIEEEGSGDVVDEVGSYAGLRSVAVSDGKFLLNGRPYYLRMVLEQGFWPESHLAAPGPDALRREVEIIKELGFNGVRVHQKVEDPRFHYWCDRLGLLVWGEMPSAYAFSPSAVERLTREWLDVVRRDYSHPCIVTWVPFNESWGVSDLWHDEAQRHFVRSVYHLTKALDPTRPVIGNDGWQHLASDIWGIHDYALDPAVIRERYGSPEAVERSLAQVQPYYYPLVLPGVERAGHPVMLTECGAVDYLPDRSGSVGHPRRADDPEDLVTRYASIVGAVLDSTALQGFCYSELTDILQERCGLLTADRRHKADPARFRAINTGPAAAAPAEMTFLNAPLPPESGGAP